MNTNHSLFARARNLMPGGVNSPVRAFKSVGGEPFFTHKAEGPCLWDVEGKRYMDYVGSWGPMIVGHNHPAVRAAVQSAIADGLSFGTPCPAEVTMSAIRLARGFTGRPRMVKFEGCYHGHGDAFLVKAGSGALTFGTPTSPGVPSAMADLTLTLPFNDFDAATALFEKIGREIAALIVEPVPGNMNCIPPRPGYLKHLRELCTHYGALLIFDEVMTGFRVALGGAQQHYGVVPDLTTPGKIIGGGMPVGAYGGRRETMEQIAPSGPIYQAGTLSGNPVAMAAGLAMLELIQAPGFHAELGRRTQLLTDGLQALADGAGIAFSTTRVGGMFGLFFSGQKVETFAQATSCDSNRFNLFFHAMLERGVYLAPSAFEAGFMSMAHSEEIIAETLRAARDAFAQLPK